MCTNGCEPSARRRSRWPWAGLLLLSLTVRSQEWTQEVFTADNGLPQSSVRSIAMDHFGYAWMVTEGGLVRFDGHRPERVPLPVSDVGPQRLREIIDLGPDGLAVRDSRSRRFVIRDGKVSLFGDPSVDRRPYPLCRGRVPSLAAYAFTTNRLWHGVQNREWLEELVTLMTINAHEWAATSTIGLLHMRDTTVVGVVPPSSPKDRYFELGGQVFGFDANGGPFRVDLVNHRSVPIALNGLPADAGPIDLTLIEPWLMTNHRSPCIVAGNELYTLRPSPSGDALEAVALHLVLPDLTSIATLLVDEVQGIALVGTNTDGLRVFRRSSMRVLRCPSADDHPNTFYAQAPLGPERVLVMSGASAISLGLDGCSDQDLPMDKFDFMGILRDSKGRFWYGSDRLRCYDPATGTTDSIGSDRLLNRCFLEEGDSIWVGTNKYIGWVKDGRVHESYAFPDHSLSEEPYCLRRGPDGALWLCSCKGVFRLNAQGSDPKPLPGMEGICVRGLQRIGDRMYLGTYGSGAWVYEHGRARRLPMDRQGYMDKVHAFMPDGLGFLWISTNRGLFRVAQQDIDAYMADSTHQVFYAFYGRSAGILNTEFNGGCDPPYIQLANGYASFPTLDGLVWFRPSDIPDAYPTAPIRIEEVLVDGVPTTDTAAIAIAPKHQELVVRFSLAYWGHAANIQLVYRLPGVQDEWYPLSPDIRELRFPHLPFGDHVLTIRKLGAPREGGHAETTLRFTVRKPYYLAGWFLVLCGGALVVLYILGIRYYQARLRRRNIQLGRIVRERTIELQQANERLQRSITVKERLVSIISHDIVTPLRFIARVAHRSAQKGQPVARTELALKLHEISNSSGKLYQNARNLLSWIKHQGGHIELRPVHVAMAPLVDEVLAPLKELAGSKGSTFINAVPLDDIVLTDRDLIGIILQNLVNNALTHGQGGRIAITGELRGDLYHIAVTDEGPGIPAQTLAAIRQIQLNGAQRTTGSLGLGFVIITELLQLLGGELVLPEATGIGTRITITLPPLIDAQARA